MHPVLSPRPVAQILTGIHGQSAQECEIHAPYYHGEVPLYIYVHMSSAGRIRQIVLTSSNPVFRPNHAHALRSYSVMERGLFVYEAFGVP